MFDKRLLYLVPQLLIDKVTAINSRPTPATENYVAQLIAIRDYVTDALNDYETRRKKRS